MILLGLFFIALGALIHFGNMYFLIAGYNTMPKEEKAKVDVTGIARLFWYVMLIIGALIILVDGVSYYIDIANLKETILFVIIITGVILLLALSNSDRYKIK